MTTSTPIPARDAGAWVHGWPFRLMLEHLAERHRTTIRAVALGAGLSEGELRILMRCRPGRGRLPLRAARALFHVRAEDVAAATRWLASQPRAAA